MPQVFDDRNPNWTGERAELRRLLSNGELRSARASTLNAHYTAASVIRAPLRPSPFKEARLQADSAPVPSMETPPAPETVKPHAFTLVQGRLARREGDSFVLLSNPSETTAQRLRGLIRVRDALPHCLATRWQDRPEDEQQRVRAALSPTCPVRPVRSSPTPRELKDMAARTLLCKLAQRGWIDLPALRMASSTRSGRRAPPLPQALGWDESLWVGQLSDLQPLRIQEVSHSKDRAARARLESCLHPYHYLGYQSRVGENLQYWVESQAGRHWSDASPRTPCKDRPTAWRRCARSVSMFN